MTATRTRTRKTVVADIDVPDDDNTPVVTGPTTSRKYFSHANCDHARKGEEGKAARAQCRRAHRAWLAAEIEAANTPVAV